MACAVRVGEGIRFSICLRRNGLDEQSYRPRADHDTRSAMPINCPLELKQRASGVIQTFSSHESHRFPSRPVCCHRARPISSNGAIHYVHLLFFPRASVRPSVRPALCVSLRPSVRPTVSSLASLRHSNFLPSSLSKSRFDSRDSRPSWLLPNNSSSLPT